MGAEYGYKVLNFHSVCYAYYASTDTEVPCIRKEIALRAPTDKIQEFQIHHTF